MRSRNHGKTPRLSPLPIAAILALSTLSACTGANPAEIRNAPPAIFPSDAALGGYAACPPNAAFQEWMDKIERQQCRLAGLKDCEK